MSLALKENLEGLKSAWGMTMAAVAAGPLALWQTDLQPPWPEGSTIVSTTACAAAIWLALVINAGVRRQVHLRVTSVAVLVAGLVLGGTYFWAYGHYVVTLDVGPRVLRVVIGDEIRPGVSLKDKTLHETLDDSLWQPEKTWTESSLRFSNGCLLATFVGSFFCLTLGSALVAFGQMKRRSQAV
jgi:hypothetical protein